MSSRLHIFGLTLLLALSVGAPTSTAQQPLTNWSIRPTEKPGGTIRLTQTELTAESVSPRVLMEIAWSISRARIVGPDGVDRGRYEITAVGPTGDPEGFRKQLRQTLEKHFDLAAHLDTQQRLVYVVQGTESAKLSPGTSGPGSGSVRSDRGTLTGKNVTLATIARVVERELGSPVIDETGLQGTNDVKLEWEHGNPHSLVQAVQSDLGLRVSEAKRPLEVLVIDRFAAFRANPQ